MSRHHELVLFLAHELADVWHVELGLPLRDQVRLVCESIGFGSTTFDHNGNVMPEGVVGLPPSQGRFAADQSASGQLFEFPVSGKFPVM